MKKILALLLALCMIACLFVGCKETEEPAPTDPSTPDESSSDESSTEEPYTGADTLVYATQAFGQKFSPFFSTVAYDTEVVDLVHAGLMGTDREGNMILNGMDGVTIPYNGTDYEYQTMANCEVVQNDDGSVEYNLTMRDDIVFSDGEPANIDDVIFGIYVSADPTYDGASTLYAVPIEGIEEYHGSMAYKYVVILNDIAENGGIENLPESEFYTADEAAAYWTAFCAAGEKFAQEIVDYMAEALGDENITVKTAAENWGYKLEEGATTADFFADIFAAYGSDFSAETGIDYESAGSSIVDLVGAELGDAAASYKELVQLADVPNISGIIRTGDYSMTVKCTKFDATAIYNMGFTVAPLHYYGDESQYDYENNKFGFPKGDLTIVKDKTTAPMGCGPYTFKSYENGVVTLESNPLYYQGAPKIKNILMTESTDADYIPGIQTGTYDLAVPSIDENAVKALGDGNGNGELTGDTFTTILVDYRGYGYLGINSNEVSVGSDGSSDASKNLRKGLMTLLSVYREVVINSWYGDRAAIIQYPISNTSWAAPRPTDEGYQNCYSVDVDGNPIYTEDMNDEQKYEAALQAAIGFFKAAGYTWDDAAGKFTAAPEGAKMEYEIIIPGDGQQNHPAYGIAVRASEDLAKIGIKLTISDVASTVWNDALEANTAQIWVAAWQATPDPDMYQVYHSTNADGKGTNSNHYQIKDSTLDELIVEARGSADNAFRKATYKDCFEIILDWACELPLYQRKDCTVASSARVNVDTLPQDMTPYWGWYAEIQNLEMN